MPTNSSSKTPVALRLPLRLGFMGTPAFAASLLAALHADRRFCLPMVWSQPDRPAGRGRQVVASAVKSFALAHNLVCNTPPRLRDASCLTQLQALNLDLLVVAAYGRLLPASWLHLPRYGCVNVHASLLPQYRGAAPIAQALLQGDSVTGISLMQMAAGLDTGPVFVRHTLPIAPTDTTRSLTDKLAHLAANCLGDHLLQIAAGQCVAQAQQQLPRLPHQMALPAVVPSYAPLLHKTAGELNFTQSAAQLARQIRAYTPWPGSFVQGKTQRLAVLTAQAVALPQPREPPAAPGTLLQADKNGLLVACGTAALRLETLQPAGRKPMSAMAWLAGHPVRLGNLLRDHL